MKNNVIIIAEAGVNHNGNLNYAIELIRIAARSGADYVKFQSFNTSSLVSNNSELATYQKENLNLQNENSSQFKMLKKLELKHEWYPKLKEECEKNCIGFLSTGFDNNNIDRLVKFGIDFIKIPSGEITNLPLLQHISKKKLPIILSTGMSNLEEIGRAIDVLTSDGITKNMITIMHCNSEYPTPFEDVNLMALRQLKEKFSVNIGYSDHTLGIEVPIASVALGATIIEKHFTLNKLLNGPDHCMSLDEIELTQMVKSIRNIEISLGDGVKKVTSSEKKNIIHVRRSIHLNKNKYKGENLKLEDLIMLRPGDGISPMDIKKVLGECINTDLKLGQKLKFEYLKQ